MNRLSSIVEPFLIVASLCMGLLVMYASSRDACNTNDFRIVKIRKISVDTNNMIVVEADIANFSAAPVKRASVIVDVLDGDNRIIGTGKYAFPSGMNINRGDTLSFSVEIPVPDKHATWKRFMTIPHSERGTGKLMTVIYL